MSDPIAPPSRNRGVSVGHKSIERLSRCRAAGLVALAVSAAACGSTNSHSNAPASAPVSAPQATAVSISGYAFHPATLTVPIGSRVTFTNHDATAHTATATTGAAGFDTGTLKPGQGKSVTFSHAGSFTYFCQFHAFMRGTVIVKG